MPSISRRLVVGRLLQVFAVGLLCIPALAQTSPPAVDPSSTEPHPDAMARGMFSANFDTGFEGVYPGATLAVRQIPGKPYSLELESEQSQTLADGTHITRKNRIRRQYRDSQGRTRTEHEAMFPALSSDPVRLIQIADPVGHVRYLFDTRSHIVHRYPIALLPTPADGDQPSGRLRARRANQVPPPSSPLSSPLSGKPHPQITREPLGTQTFEGLLAEGVRVTITEPVDWEGNDRPIEAVCEHWTAIDLKVIVMSKCSDPRRGDTGMHVTHAELADPDPSLFQVPAGYKVIQDKTRSAGPLIRPVLAP